MFRVIEKEFGRAKELGYAKRVRSHVEGKTIYQEWKRAYGGIKG